MHDPPLGHNPDIHRTRLRGDIREQPALVGLAARFGVLVLAMSAVAELSAAEPTAEQFEYFETQVRPVLVEHCYECHSARTQDVKGGLRLDRRAAAMAGGDSGPVIEPGEPDESLLIEAIRWETSGFQMPPKSRMPAEAVAALERWVRDGAAWPPEAEEKAAGPPASFDLAARRAEHWCWHAPRASRPPEVKDASWAAGPVDQFLLARLEQAGLQPAPPADRRTLIRRLSFDLLGLPPAVEEVEAFVADESPDAYPRLVDRLLQSPHFGERWARHWLDLVRYAESRGHEFDPTIPNAWQYRDYVVRAFNADVPYDQFVREHLAGDLLTPRQGSQGENESILGTGFWFLGEEVHSPVDIRQDEADRMDNRLDVMGKTFLALTVACARCHDHKFDALSQEDYYALTGYLISSSYRQVRFATFEQDRRIAAELDALRTAAESRLRRAVGELLLTAAGRIPAWLAASGQALSGRSPAEAASGAGLPDAAVRLGSEELKVAQANPADPLFAYAAVIGRAQSEGARAYDAAMRRLHQPQESETPASPQAVVVDYEAHDPGLWLQDGFSFGPRPARAGALRFSTDGLGGVAGLVTRASAQRDGIWAGLKPAGVERDHGALGDWDRPGQTLRTPEFTLRAGRVWYLVRGVGRAYAVVNNHLIVAGPLHGRLLREWQDESGHWQWIEHSLEAYRGHRVHVEFTPRDAGDFAVARVVCADQRPPPAERTNPLILDAIAAAADRSPESIAAAIGRACTQAAVDVRDGRTDRPGSAALADWLFARLDPLTAGLDAERARYDDATGEFRAAQAALAEQIQREAPTAPGMFEGSGVDEFLLVRGSTRTPGSPVPRRFLAALGGAPSTGGLGGSGRLELAERIASDQNPLTARVIVNRVWHHLFGRGLVATVDNFGALGQPPSHPELLDWLAVHFTRDLNWSIKSLVRELLLSQAYRMSSRPDDARAEQADPENVLLHRAHLRRLEGEAIRDAMLFVSGRLNPAVGGPSVPVHLTEFLEGRGRPPGGPLDGDGRRSLYIAVRRNFLSPFLLAFDMPIPFNAMGRRNVSNVPAQALLLMNDPLVYELSRTWARRVLEQPAAPEARVEVMIRAAFGRPAEPAELTAALEFLEGQRRQYGLSPELGQDDPRVWADLAHALFNVKEFIYLP